MAPNKPFELFAIPLAGTRLIEASAGTGKTYTIAGLFVRLLLEKELTVEQILVVTYTKAATQELKSRIRRRIAQARRGFLTGRADGDPLIGALIEKTADHRRASRLLGDALTDFDRAAIFTIHGFCQRLLHDNAFETGSLFDTELITDPRDLRREIAEDFWRIHFYPAPAEWITFAARYGTRDPAFFERLSAGVHFPEANIIPRLPRPELNSLEPYRQQFRLLANRWPKAREQVLELMRSPGLDGRKYGSLAMAGRQKAVSKRDIRLAALTAEMDRFTEASQPEFPPFTALDRFTASGLLSAVRKGHQPLQHDLFDICDELQTTAQILEAEMQQLMLYLKVEFFDWMRSEALKRKKTRNIYHYDDLLLTVKHALSPASEGNAGMLVENTRKKYRAALVDEFQDTDTVQYDIFSAIFGTDDSLLFIIGDPKQSIYSFRGADIFSYIAAAAHAESGYTLQQNWRSEPGLIKAVHTLFSGPRTPFLFDAIACEPVTPGRTSESGTPTTHPSLVLWYLPSEGKQPINKTDAVPLISEAVGDEIVRLTTADSAAVAPSDIAVLVRTNRQAQIIKNSLAKREIPAVLYSSGSVFNTRESAELLRVLTAVIERGGESHFRAALATDMIGVSGDALARIDDVAVGWEHRRRRFQAYADTWKRSGFIRMFRTLMVREKVRRRLLAFTDGERRLTNLLHLAEVLHRETVRRQLTPVALIKWLADRCGSDAPGEDEHQLRLESDELAVNIVTIHKSKGLEYPIVFCPYGWDGSALRPDDPVIFHAADSDGRLTVDLGSDRLDTNRTLAQHELLAENLRLLYVAVTRAKKRCYLAWGRIRSAETSALAYLLHLGDSAGEVDVLAAMRQRFAALDEKELMADLQRLAERSEETISIEKLPRRSGMPLRPIAAEDENLVCPVFSGRIEAHWKITSYSTMVSRQHQDAGLPDHDIDLQLPAAVGVETLDQPRLHADRWSVFQFPRGARAGIFFHDLLEQLEFSPASAQDRADLIRVKLKQYGYDPGWQHTLLQTVENLLQVELPAVPAGREHIHLSRVTANRRINEMEFYFPQKSVSPERLGSIFERHGGAQLSTEFARHLRKLSFAPTDGFFMGYVDMLFEHEDRFYLLDWKSNHLGHRIENYCLDRLTDVMVREHYILQYNLYTIAANRYLTQRHPGYSYAKHFGGVFYVFIRGVDAAAGAAYGIYHDRPASDLILALDDALIE